MNYTLAHNTLVRKPICRDLNFIVSKTIAGGQQKVRMQQSRKPLLLPLGLVEEV